MGAFTDNLFKAQETSSETPNESAFEKAMRMMQEEEEASKAAPIENQIKEEDKGWLKTAKSYYTATAHAYDLASNQMEIGRLAYKGMVGELTPTEKKRLAELERTNDKINQSIKDSPYVTKAFGTIAPYIVESAKQGGKGALIGSIIGGTTAAVAGNLVPGMAGAPEELLTAPAGALVGAKIGGMFSSLENMREIEAGQAYMQMRKAGISPGISETFAQLYGAGSTGLEAAQFKLLGRLVPGGEQIGQKILQSATTQWLSTIGKKTVPEAAKRMVGTAAGEAGIESAQQVYQNFTEVLAREANDYLNNTKLSPEHRRNFTNALTKDVVDTFLLTFTGMGIAGIPGAAVNAALPGQKKPKVITDDVVNEIDKIFGREARQGSIDTFAMMDANQAIIDKTMPEEPKSPLQRRTPADIQEVLNRFEYTSGGVSRGNVELQTTPEEQQEIIRRVMPDMPVEAIQRLTPDQKQQIIDRVGQDLPGVGSNIHPGEALPPPSTIGPRPFQLEPPPWKVTPEGQAINPVPPEVDARLSPPSQLTGVDYRVTPEGQAVPRLEVQGEAIATQGMQQVVQPQQAASLPSQPPPDTTIETATPVLTSPDPATGAPPIPSPTNELNDVMGMQQAQVYAPTEIDPETQQPVDFVPVPVDPNKMPYMPPRTKSGELQVRGLKEKLSRPAGLLRDGTLVEGPVVEPVVWSKPTKENATQWIDSIEEIKKKIGPDWRGKVVWLKDEKNINPETGEPTMVPALGFKLDTASDAPNPSLPTFISNVQLNNEAGMEEIFMRQGKKIKQREVNKQKEVRPITEEQRALIVHKDNREWLNKLIGRTVASITNKHRDLKESDVRDAVNEAIVKAAKTYNITEDGDEVNYRTAEARNQKFKETVQRRLKDYTKKIAIKDRYGSNRLANERRMMEGQMPTRTDKDGNVTEVIPDMLDREIEPATAVEQEPAPPPPPVRRFTGEAAQAYAKKKGIPVTKTIEVKKKPVSKPATTATPSISRSKEHLSPANVGETIQAARTSLHEATITSPNGNTIVQHSMTGTAEQFEKKIQDDLKKVDTRWKVERRIDNYYLIDSNRADPWANPEKFGKGEKGRNAALLIAETRNKKELQIEGEPRVSISSSVTGIPSSEHKIVSVKEPTTGKLITPAKLADMLGNERGGSLILNTAASKAMAAIGTMQKASNEVAAFFDVESPWKKKGMPEIGFAIKNLFAQPDLQEKLGQQDGVQFYKILRYDFGGAISREDQTKVLLAYEDPSYLSSQPADWQKKAARSIQYLKDWTVEKQRVMKERGLNLDFYARMQALYEGKAEITKDPIKRQHYLDMAKRAKELNFAHIPAQMIFEQQMREHVDARSDAEREKYAAYLKSILASRRDTFTIGSFFQPDKEGDTLLELGDVTPAHVMLSYAWRFGRDMAMLDVRDAIRDHGKSLYQVSRKEPDATDGNFWVKVPRSMPILESLNNKSKEHQVWLRSDFLQDLNNALVYSSTPRNMWDITATWIKMAQFYNPIMLPMNNLAQLIMAGIPPHKWDFKRAIKDIGGGEVILKGHGYGQKSPAYIEAATHGGLSQPYSNPYFRMESIAEFMSREKAGVAGAVKGMFDRFVSEKESLRKNVPAAFAWTSVPRAVLPMIYGASSHAAWTMEEVTRMVAYNHFKDQGHESRDAAQLAAKFMGDYASVPAGTRRKLNKLFFTPTYIISMMKLIGEMTGAVLKTAINPTAIKSFARSNKDARYKVQRRMVYAGIGTIALNIGYRAFMQAMGADEEEFGRTYSFEVDTKEGPKKLVVTLSLPSNLPQRFWYRGFKTFFPEATEQRGLFERFKDYMVYPWLTPAIAKPMDLLDNRTQVGKVFDNPYATNDEKLTAFINWMADTTFPLISRGVADAFELRENRDKAAQYFVEEHGKLTNELIDLFAFKYLKDKDDIATSKKMQQMNSKFNYILKREFVDTGKINPEHVENFKKRMLEAAELLREKK